MNDIPSSIIDEMVVTTSGLIYGSMISICVVGVAIVFIMNLNDKKELSVLSYLIALATCGLLTYHISRIVGACELSDKVTQVSNMVKKFSPAVGEYLSDFQSEYMGGFIFRRVMWSLLFGGLGVVGMIFTSEKKKRTFDRHGRGVGMNGLRYRKTSNRRQDNHLKY